MGAARSPIRAVAIVLGGLMLQAGAASAQHGGGGHGGGGHGGGGHGGGHYGGGHYAGGSHYSGGGHGGGYYSHGNRGVYSRGHYYPRLYLYGGLYGYFGYPYYYGYPYYGYGYPYFPYGGYGSSGYGYGRDEYDDTGAVRVRVEPNEARVFVDGYYAGIADDFDGRSQRLRLPAGRHEIVLKLEGYRTHRIKVHVPAGRPLAIRYRMARGTGEDAEDLTPDRYLDETRGRRDPQEDGVLSGAGPDADRGDEPRGGRVESEGRGAGELRLSVQPGDAVVYVDGEFRGPGREVGRLELAPGRHSIEVVRPGFQTFQRSIEVKRDRPVDLDVELRTAGS